MVFKNICIFVFGTKVASALEGLICFLIMLPQQKTFIVQATILYSYYVVIMYTAGFRISRICIMVNECDTCSGTAAYLPTMVFSVSCIQKEVLNEFFMQLFIQFKNQWYHSKNLCESFHFIYISSII